MKAENKRLSDLLEAKQETIDSLNNTMRLLEDQRPKASTEEHKKEEVKSFLSVFSTGKNLTLKRFL